MDSTRKKTALERNSGPRPRSTPTDADWFYVIQRRPNFQYWVEVYDAQLKQFRVARLLPNYRWEYENGEVRGFSSALKWRDPDANP